MGTLYLRDLHMYPIIFFWWTPLSSRGEHKKGKGDVGTILFYNGMQKMHWQPSISIFMSPLEEIKKEENEFVF